MATNLPSPPKETLEHIERTLRELCVIARANNLDMLSYLVDMAYLEVKDIGDGLRPAFGSIF